MRLLFDHFESDRMVICLDTANIELMEDFFSDRSMTRLLEIECTFNDDYLAGHARRIGLAGPETSDETMARLLPTIHHDMIYQRDAIRDAKFPHTFRMSDRASDDQNATALAGFLGVNIEVAQTLAQTPHLFVD